MNGFNLCNSNLIEVIEMSSTLPLDHCTSEKKQQRYLYKIFKCISVFNKPKN